MRRHSKGYNFVGDPNTGITFRWGTSFKDNPIMSPWPELADVSISNYCTNSCEYCYRKSNPSGKTISVGDYRYLLGQLTSKQYGSVFQVALGGGEPLLHPNLIEILKITREDFDIIPNYTTNGLFFNEDTIQATRDYCGAIAVSFDSYRNDLSFDDLFELGKSLRKEKIKTNIHYVISEKTIKQAIEILEGNYDRYISIFNSIIFLTYKPAGKAKRQDCLKSHDLIGQFLKLVDNHRSKLKIGFDACFIPVLFKATSIDLDLLDSCECGFFSVYIDENLNAMPCSFCNNKNYIFSLKEFQFEDIWLNKFSSYRHYVSNTCKTHCKHSSNCRGKCPFFKDIFLCDSLETSEINS